jgi:hypothetical protein
MGSEPAPSIDVGGFDAVDRSAAPERCAAWMDRQRAGVGDPMLEALHLGPDDDALDIGCGSGVDLATMAPLVHRAAGVDQSHAMRSVSAPRVRRISVWRPEEASSAERTTNGGRRIVLSGSTRMSALRYHRSVKASVTERAPQPGGRFRRTITGPRRLRSVSRCAEYRMVAGSPARSFSSSPVTTAPVGVTGPLISAARSASARPGSWLASSTASMFSTGSNPGRQPSTNRSPTMRAIGRIGRSAGSGSSRAR